MTTDSRSKREKQTGQSMKTLKYAKGIRRNKEVSKMKYKCPHCEKIVEGIETPFKSDYHTSDGMGRGRLVIIECPECHQKFIRRDEWGYIGTAIAKDEQTVKGMVLAPYVEPEEPKKMIKVKKYKCTDDGELYDTLEDLEDMVFENIDNDTVAEFIDDTYDRVEIGCYYWRPSEVIDNMGDFSDFKDDDDFKEWVRDNNSDNYMGNDDVSEMVVGTEFSLGGYDFAVVEVEEEEE